MVGYRKALAVLSACVVASSVSVVQPAPATAAPSATLTVRNVEPIRGEVVTLHGALPTRFARTVLVQYLAGGTWHTVRSLRSQVSGSYSWSARASVTRNYRVLAPATRHRHQKIAATVTPSRTVMVIAQSGTLTTPTAAQRSPVALRARFRPVRPGRLVTLQRQVGTGWTTVSSGRQSAAGEAAFSYSPTRSAALMTTRLRAVVSAADGATSLATPVIDVQNPVAAATPPAPPVVETPVVETPVLETPADTVVSVDDSEVSLWGGSPSISDDGNLVAFMGSYPDDPSGRQRGGIFVRDLATGRTRAILTTPDSAGHSYPSGSPVISGNGRYVVFTTDDPSIATQRESGTPQLVRYDLTTGITELVSRPTLAGQDLLGGTEPSISTDGSRIAFVGNTQVSDGNTDKLLYVRDMSSTDGWLVPPPPSIISWYRWSPTISGNGRFLAYGDSRPQPGSELSGGSFPLRLDVFRYDLQTGTTDAVSVASSGALADSDSRDPAISSDGHLVSFASSANDVVAGSVGGYRAYVRDMAAGTTRSRPGDQGLEGRLLEDTSTLSAGGSTLAALWFVPDSCYEAWCEKQLRIYDLASGRYRAVSNSDGTLWDTLNGIQLTADGRYGVYALRGQVHRFAVLGYPQQ